MICTVLGIFPCDLEVYESIRQNLNTVNDSSSNVKITWRNAYSIVNDDDRDGAETLLMQAVTSNNDDDHDSAKPEDVVKAVQTYLSNMGKEETICEMWASAPAPLPLRPPGDGYAFIRSQKQELDLVDSKFWKTQAIQIMREWGIIMQQNILDAATVQKFRLIVNRAIAEAEAELALHRPDINVGKDDLFFKEIASRNLERFDLRLTSSDALDIVHNDILGKSSIREFLENVMGESMDEIDFDLSVVYSKPGANTQGWHADGNHQKGAKDAGWDENGWKTQLADAYAVCLFIPLIDLNCDTGYTRFWPGSHRSKNLLGFGPFAGVAGSTFDAIGEKGGGIWYDYRLFHHGMPNKSNVVRPVVQVVFKKKWYVERVNYGKESISDRMDEKMILSGNE